MENPIKKTINGIDVYYIISDKFKTITWSFICLHPEGRELINEYYFLGNILVDDMQKYPSNELKYRYQSELYGLEAYGSAKNVGNHIFNQFVVTYPNEKYIDGEEQLSTNAFKYLMEIITNPKLRQGRFTKKSLSDNLEEANQLDQLLRSVKDMFAYYEYSNAFYEDKPGLQFNFPEQRALSHVTMESLWEAYQHFFERDAIAIFVTGDIEEAKIDQIIQAHLPAKIKHHPMAVKPKVFPYDPNKEARIIRRYDDVSATRLFIGWQTDVAYFSDRHAAMSVFNNIFGGFDQSRLFMDIREQQHLAYYVDSNYMPDEQMLTVAVSCEKSAEDMIVERVMSILNDIIEGGFSDNLLAQAREDCINSLYSINDSQSTYLFQHIRSYQLFNKKYDLEQRIAAYQSVTREDVCDVAKTLVLDTVFYYTKEDDVDEDC